MDRVREASSGNDRRSSGDSIQTPMGAKQFIGITLCSPFAFFQERSISNFQG